MNDSERKQIMSSTLWAAAEIERLRKICDTLSAQMARYAVALSEIAERRDGAGHIAREALKSDPIPSTTVGEQNADD